MEEVGGKMRLTFRFISVFLFFAFVVGCAAAKFAQTGQTYPPYDEPVKVYWAPPKEVKYVEIGIVSSAGGIIHQWADLIEAMQKEAAKKGANGIIVGGPDDSTHTMMIYNSNFGLPGGTFPQKNMIAIAIRILE
jgi:hypothetical protein